MKSKKLLSLLLVLAMMFSLTVTASAEEAAVISAAPADEIVILHTNDVHCSYEAYDKVAALAKDADLLVDAGDAIQGGVIGTLSKGEYIVDIMNEIGYDAAVPGNHEFDYDMDQFLKLAKEKAEYPYLSANFVDKTGKPVFDAYKLFEVDGKKVAFVGLTTPETFTKSTPTYFQDGNGNYIYGFCEGGNGQELYAAAQKAIDAAEAAGADYVIGLGHLGIDGESSPWTSKEVIANTTGFDAFIDGHSHSTFAETVKDKAGNDVAFAQTGTKLANVGKITIKADGTITCENIDLANVTADADTTAYIAGVTEKFDALQNTVVAKTEVELTINGADGKRAVRSAETNLGDLCADAYRVMLGADVAFVNGGGVRANLAAGDITYGDIVNVHPFGNEACLVKVTGQQIKDALELGASAYPGESGGFLQVSGLTYTIDSTIPSSVVRDEKNMFVKVDGAYRVSDIQVGGQPLDVNKTYTLASHNYMLKSQGDGYAMFGTDNVEIIKDCVMIDNQVLINYIVEELNGTVGQEYAAPAGRITIVTAPAEPEQPVEPAKPAEPEKPAAESGTYTVVAGDCLWSIAQKTYGTGTKWGVIYEANKATVKDPGMIYIGQVLTIPAA
ncbi:5'-nucleotidase C-terminal domain-containing protein [Oscillibacter valericigenes]|uniref:5'-nucleotidase C-terminal domain-containing protein n=1 Tax=Oscillibacter valericigenes TaxID=351091 RepID=UPI001F2A2C1C|nr:5'-nucleotidase C-terminal domain-containing protein [Oscillibacter valericigenes]MCF2616785.1 5'-nucleotidase C-terminal domain-containing protein [Oscillibacter valericigenes]